MCKSFESFKKVNNVHGCMNNKLTVPLGVQTRQSIRNMIFIIHMEEHTFCA